MQDNSRNESFHALDNDCNIRIQAIPSDWHASSLKTYQEVLWLDKIKR